MALVSLEDAKESLDVIGGYDDNQISNSLYDAEDWAVEIMGQNYDDDWDESTVPGRVRSAILVYLKSQYDDDTEGKYLDIANRLIERWRDHVVA